MSLEDFFKEGLVSYERKMAYQNRKVLLVMDLCTAHNKEGNSLQHVCLLFYLLPNITIYMQLLDQAIIRCLQQVHRRHVVCFLLCEKWIGLLPQNT
jgi:hypothetical protein